MARNENGGVPPVLPMGPGLRRGGCEKRPESGLGLPMPWRRLHRPLAVVARAWSDRAKVSDEDYIFNLHRLSVRPGSCRIYPVPAKRGLPGISSVSRENMTQAKKVFIRTFGCQMNEYDSDKMADVLAAAEGFEKTSNVAEADLILFNTCSVREKAQEKVFADLGRVKPLKQARPGVMIGVGGCVASQEGEEIVRRAPFVDVVFGPQTLHRLPQLLDERRRTGRPQVDISFPEIE